MFFVLPRNRIIQIFLLRNIGRGIGDIFRALIVLPRLRDIRRFCRHNGVLFINQNLMMSVTSRHHMRRNFHLSPRVVPNFSLTFNINSWNNGGLRGVLFQVSVHGKIGIRAFLRIGNVRCPSFVELVRSLTLYIPRQFPIFVRL